ncbi:MAG: energy coupling factor transporter S component ThiW [Clostridiales bacterium]|nr:energy coupling factor transporter S component ThiW [Clostridiales bacterium]
MNREHGTITTRKMVFTAMLACLSFVLCTFVYFPAMAPFQHFIDVIAEIILGPWYAFAAALICGVMRMMSGRTIQAVMGAIFGPIVGGLLYRRTKNIWLAWLGEVIGTGFCGAMASYPLMKLFYGLDVINPFYYIPYYTPSAVVGGGMGLAVILILKRSGMLRVILETLEEERSRRTIR